MIESNEAYELQEHLNVVSRAIRDVNQLITREKDPERLIKGACDCLIENRGYHNAWIAILNDDGRWETSAEAGLGESFILIEEQLKRGEATDCGQSALRQSEVEVIENPAAACKDCPLSAKYGGGGAMTVRLEHGGKVYGVFSVSIPAEFIVDEEEQALFKEVAGDIAFALHSIELEGARTRAEEALLQSEIKYRTLTETVNDTIFTLDGDGNFTYLNPEFEKLLGFKVKDFLGHSFTEILAPEYIESTFDRFKRGLAGEKIPLYDVEVIHKDRRRVPVELNVTSLLDSKGRTIGRLGVARDITERKRAEEALRESEEHYRTIFESLPVGIFHLTPEGTITSANPAVAHVFGFESPDEFMTVVNRSGVAEALYAHPEKRSPAVDIALKQEGWVAFENQYLRKDGEVITGNVLFRAVKNPDGTINHLEGFIEDITDRKHAEEQIKASLHEKEVLLKEIHHRVKNNLQIISSLLHLQSRHVTDKEALELFDDCRSRIMSMSLIHEKLYQSEDMARIDFAGYIRTLIGNLFHSYNVNPRDIKLKVDAKDVFLDVNTGIPCGLIINELVSNSLKHAFHDGRKGEIQVGLYKQKDGEFTLNVRDNGSGFPADLDFRNTESLGMQIVITLVEQLEGRIELYRGEGTSFTIRFGAPPFK